MSRDTTDVETEDIPDLETVRSEVVGIKYCMITSVVDNIENQVSNGNIFSLCLVVRIRLERKDKINLIALQ